MEHGSARALPSAGLLLRVFREDVLACDVRFTGHVMKPQDLSQLVTRAYPSPTSGA